MVESLLFICSALLGQNDSSENDQSQQPWSRASMSLLSLLLSYENAVENSDNKTTYPPFLVEFHSVWKAQEEKEELAQKIKDKDRQITVLLTGTTDDATEKYSALMATPSSVMTTDVLKVVEGLRSLVEATNQKNESQQNLLKQLQKATAAVVTLKEEKKELEDQIQKAEKKFSRSEESVLDRGRIPQHLFPDREAEAFEAAKEAWRHERVLLECSKEEKEKEINILRHKIMNMEEEIADAAKKFGRLVAQLDKNAESLTVRLFSQN